MVGEIGAPDRRRVEVVTPARKHEQMEVGAGDGFADEPAAVRESAVDPVEVGAQLANRGGNDRLLPAGLR